MDELIEFIKANTQQTLAESLGVTQGAISQWIAGGKVPIRRVRAVSLVTGIAPAKLHPDFSLEAA